jgi:hypothetical protein
MIEGAVANVIDYGAVGNGVANDTAAIQAAIDFIGGQSPAGGVVYLPKGLYLTDATLDLDYDNVRLVGEATGVNHNTGGTVEQDGATQIIGGHVNGAVVRIWNRGCSVENLVVSSTATRRAATSGTNVYGIWVETVDSSFGNLNGPWRILINRVHVTKQPLHGIVMIGNAIHSEITFTDVDNCGGHGIVLDDGTITGRTNKERIGQINLFSIRSSRVGGSAIKIGDIAGALTNLPYRINVNNAECFFTLLNPAVYNADGKQGAISGFMENCDFISCAFSGTRLSGGASNNGLYIAGTFNVIRNCRFINCEPYCAYIDDYGASYRTTDIRFETLYIVNSTQPSGYYDPAVYVSNPNIRNIKVSANTYFNDVNSLLDLTASKLAESEFRDRKQFNGVYISNYSSWVSISIDDDAAGYFTIGTDRGRTGSIVINGNASSAQSGMVTYRVGDGNAFCSELSGTANFATTTGALAGTTGADGFLTISADTVTDRVYVENRTGETRTYSITNLCALGTVTNFTLV